MAGVHTYLIFVSGLMACIFSLSMAATEHTVGGEDFGWQIPQTKSFYQDWADARTFTVGDKLSKFFFPMHTQ